MNFMTRRTRFVAGLAFMGGISTLAAGCGQSTQPISSAHTQPPAHHTTQPSKPAKTATASASNGPTPYSSMSLAATAQKPTIGTQLAIPSQKPLPAPKNMTWVLLPVTVKNPGDASATVTSLNFGLTAGTSTYASIAALDGDLGGLFTTKDVSGQGSSQLASTTLAAHQQVSGKLVFLVPSAMAQQSLSLVLGGSKVSVP